MNNKDIRYMNCRYLVKSRESGVVEMAHKLQKEQSQISQFAGKTRKKNVGDMIAAQIEKAYGLPDGWLDQVHPEEWKRVGLEFELPQEANKVGENRANYMVPLAVWDDETPLDDDEVEISCFTEVEAAAGPGRTVIQENHGPKIRFSRRTLRKCGVIEENAYGIMVSGNSMMPVMPHGATIGVDVGSTKILDGEMYAVDHDGMLRVKLLYRVPGNQVRLVSFNREEHADETVSLEDGKLRVIGRVFWYSVLRPAFR